MHPSSTAQLEAPLRSARFKFEACYLVAVIAVSHVGRCPNDPVCVSCHSFFAACFCTKFPSMACAYQCNFPAGSEAEVG